MMLLCCPNCRERPEWEFTFGGPAHIARPVPAERVTDAQWAAYLFFRDNPKGWHRERWCHSYGCNEWFNVERHTVTHEIRAVYRMGASAPEEG